jgi:hypothetical protein
MPGLVEGNGHRANANRFVHRNSLPLR